MNLGNTQLEFGFESAVDLLTDHLPVAKRERKPVLMHAIRVGMHLYENDYSEDVVLGGLLHDILEQSDIDPEIIRTAFGDQVLKIVLANSQNKEIDDTVEKWKDMVDRCVEAGEEALIVKAADVLDSLRYYKARENQPEIERSLGIGSYLLEVLPENVQDSIFDKLTV